MFNFLLGLAASSAFDIAKLGKIIKLIIDFIMGLINK